ncbi:MAG: class I SAM-dependent methyltransferase [Gammaproteobacteria bacterium]|nr:class I SAM-dependent methyltransferase [Gammaproteobacteria bacterium]MCK5262597.1 class I SAM-dependent methyltransferase [Gammaproteobacteria bacterium]
MSDRKSHWDNIYKDKPALEVSWYQSEPVLSLQLIHNTQLASDAAIIDVGGGASVLVDHLCNEGYSNVAVLDISTNALACAKDRLGDKAGSVEWFDEDITRFNPPHQFLLWHDRAVFHFLTEEADRRSYVEVLKQALAPNGHLIIAAFVIGGPTQCSGLDIVQYDAEKLQAELGDAFELIEEISELHITPTNKEQKFDYFRFVRK